MRIQSAYSRIENPYIPQRPARERTEFFGRENAIEAVRNSLGNAPGERPLVICGPTGVGKTSLLHRLEAGVLGTELGVLYADIQSMDHSTVSSFLWHLAKTIMSSMEHQNLEGPVIEKRMLVLNPQLVFRQRFWNPLLLRAHSVPLLFAWDNFDSLAEPSSSKHDFQSLRVYLYSLFRTEAPVDLLLSITGRVEAVGETALAPFQLQRYHRMVNLDRLHTLRLIQQSESWSIFRPVAEFIYALTGGHPGDTQRLCHALFERQWRRGHQQATVTDVIAVLSEDLSPSDFVGTTYGRLSSPASAPY